MSATAPARDDSQVVVIVGASSGIGRATAHAFAEAGARLVLAARSEESLVEVRAECALLGAESLVVPVDIARDDDVTDLVDRAVARFGRIDVWVGAASVFAYGTFEQTPAAVFRQVLEVNLFGQARGARAVLPQLRRQGSGTIIFVGSLFSRVAAPYVSAYVTSKHAILGLAESIRLEEQLTGISVCTVLPATVDTPIYQHSANFTGRPAGALPPAAKPERVARAIVRLAHRAHPRPRTLVGLIQSAVIPLTRIAPRLTGRLTLWAMDHIALRRGQAPDTAGTTFEPAPSTNSISGGWRGRSPMAMAGAVEVPEGAPVDGVAYSSDEDGPTEATAIGTPGTSSRSVSASSPSP